MNATADEPIAALNPRADGFCAAMRELVGAVSAITCRHGDRLAGFVATSVSPFSLDPPSLIVSVNQSSSSWPVLREARGFGVNILSSGHRELADRFSSRGAATDGERFEGANWLTLRTGAPILETALASFDCAIIEIIERYTHAIVLGRVEASRQRSGSGALVYWRGVYDQLGWSQEEISNAVGLASGVRRALSVSSRRERGANRRDADP